MSALSPIGKAHAVVLLGERVAESAMTTFATLHPEGRHATEAELDAVTEAMREASRHVIDQMLKDIKDAPWLAEQAFTVAILEIVQAGAEKLPTQYRSPSATDAEAKDG